jgi:hypothetical protein
MSGVYPRFLWLVNLVIPGPPLGGGKEAGGLSTQYLTIISSENFATSFYKSSQGLL